MILDFPGTGIGWAQPAMFALSPSLSCGTHGEASLRWVHECFYPGVQTTMLVRDDETRALLKQLALYLAGQGTQERALGARLERLATEGQGRLTIADLTVVREKLRSQKKAIAEALRDADAEAEVADAEVQVALLEAGQGALQRLFELDRAKPSYLVNLKPEFGHLPDYEGRIEVGRTYRAFFSPDHADFMSLVGTDITHAQKRHFDIRPG